jgi:hypothetical protein
MSIFLRMFRPYFILIDVMCIKQFFYVIDMKNYLKLKTTRTLRIILIHRLTMNYLSLIE